MAWSAGISLKGARGSRLYYGSGAPSASAYPNLGPGDAYIDTQNRVMYLATSGTNGTVAFTPPTSAGPQAYIVTVSGGTINQSYSQGTELYPDFMIAGTQTPQRFPMPTAGYLLGFSVFGQLDSAQQVGFYLTKKDLSGAYTDEVHLAPGDQASSDLSLGFNYACPSPIAYAKGEMVSIKMDINPTQTVNAQAVAYLHIQYATSAVASGLPITTSS